MRYDVKRNHTIYRRDSATIFMAKIGKKLSNDILLAMAWVMVCRLVMVAENFVRVSLSRPFFIDDELSEKIGLFWSPYDKKAMQSKNPDKASSYTPDR
jgi:hypothetical protein